MTLKEAIIKNELRCSCKRRVQKKHWHFLCKHVLPGHEFAHGCIVYSRADKTSIYGYAKGYTAKPRSKGSKRVPLRLAALLRDNPHYFF